MSKEKWERRYAERDPESPGDPNPVFVEEVAKLGAGRALDLAAGDGRHAIHLARQGWDVTAVDFSQTAIDRGRRFSAAATGSGTITWVRADLTDYSPPVGSFDLVIIMFLHIPWNEMTTVIARAQAAVAPGGSFLLLGHHRDNLGRGTGGPQDPEVLYSEADVARQLTELRIERQAAIDRPPEHAGEAPRGTDALALDCLVRARRPH